jgi:hypothetical protein
MALPHSDRRHSHLLQINADVFRVAKFKNTDDRGDGVYLSRRCDP